MICFTHREDLAPLGVFPALLRWNTMQQKRKPQTFLVTASALIFIFLTLAAPLFAVSKFKVLFRFTGADGYRPFGGMISDASGNLYGTTQEGGANDGCEHGCGTVFELSPQGTGKWSERVLYSFCSVQNCVDGVSPLSGLIFDKAGNLYGTTFFGGANQGGTVFELTPDANGTWSEKVLYSFCSAGICADGLYPDNGPLAFDAAGNLYGTTVDGGANQGDGRCNDNPGCGTVFELTRGNNGKWTEKVLHSFCAESNCADGVNPYSSVILDAKGNLYGTTWTGGTGYGVVFELLNAGGKWTEKVLETFVGVNGANPDANLIFDAAGNLFGVAGDGGQGGAGAVFEFVRGKNRQYLKLLHSFYVNGMDGWGPGASLAFDAKGNLYGTTVGGGDHNGGGLCTDGCGAVFELKPGGHGTWIEKSCTTSVLTVIAPMESNHTLT
jgi:uncharacterized repeat protein (TIGR03803 family)